MGWYDAFVTLRALVQDDRKSIDHKAALLILIGTALTCHHSPHLAQRHLLTWHGGPTTGPFLAEGPKRARGYPISKA